MCRCGGWPLWDTMTDYHDTEWGTPLHDDRAQFEHLMLEALQCGLSWTVIMRKRDVIRSCFEGFDFEKIARYDEADVERILSTEGMIKCRRKIVAVIENARRFIEVRAEFGSFDNYIWGFTGRKTLLYEGHEKGEVPTKNALSEAISRDLRRRGFSYLGPVTVYAHLQASGIINDHEERCFRYAEINARHPTLCVTEDFAGV